LDSLGGQRAATDINIRNRLN